MTKRANVFGFPVEDRPPDWPDCAVVLVDALRDYLWRLELDNEAYEFDYRLEHGASPPTNKEAERKWNVLMQTAKLLLKQLEEDEVDPFLAERLKR
jgi:hypothetical protein